MGCQFQHWVHVCQTFHDFVGTSFKRWSQFVYRHTEPVIIVSVVVSLVLIGGFYKFNIYGQSERIFYPQDSKIFRDLNRAQRSFEYYVQYEEFILVREDGDNRYDGDKNNGGNRNNLNSEKDKDKNENFYKTALQISLDIHNGIMNIPGFEEFCLLSTMGTCSVLSPLEPFQFNHNSLNNIQSKLITTYINQSRIMNNGLTPQMNFPHIFGNFDINVSTNAFTTNVLRTSYPVKFGATREQYERNKLWEAKFNDYLTSWRTNITTKGMKLVVNTVRSMDDSVEKNTTDNLLLITVSIGAMVLFCALAMHHIGSKIKGHFLLSLFGIGAITFGIGAAFGLTLYTGLPYVGFVGVLPFLILGVGIDDMFIIVDKIDLLRAKGLKGSELLGVAMQQVGFSITMTTVTDLIAFIIGTVSNFPAVQIFCIYAFLSLVFVYGLIVTLFIALLSMDIRRMEGMKMDCLPCVTSEEKEEEGDGNGMLLTAMERLDYPSKLMGCYSRFLMKPFSKAFVIITASLLLAMGVYGTIHTDLNFDYKILGAQESSYVTWMNTMETHFPIGRFPMDVVMDTPGVDYSSVEVQQMFYRLNQIVQRDDYFDNMTINWMTSYLDWKRMIDHDRGFYNGLVDFLALHHQFKNDLVFDSNNKIIASRIHVFTINSTNWLFRRDAMLSLNKQLDEMKPLHSETKPFYSVSFQFIYLSQLVTIIWSTSVNIFICCFVILFITIPFVINPIISLLFLVSFICFVIELLGVMYLWSLSLNSITMIVMVMAIGFTVDYSCHITHAYLMADGESADERMQVAIMTVGASVLKGGLSTLTGIIVLSVSSSQLFFLFFKMMFTVIILGLIHGMFILPVLLTFFSRKKMFVLKVSSDGKVLHATTNEKKKQKVEDEHAILPLRTSDV